MREAHFRAWERSEKGQEIDSLEASVTTVALNISRSGLRRLRSERRARTRLDAPRAGEPHAVWHAHQTTLVLRGDAQLRVVDIRDLREPVTAGPEGLSFLSGETLCGSNLGP